MAIRMSGLVSGLDTESIVEQLMSAQSMKKTKVENKKTKLEWKQEKWKDLNTKLYKLYTDQVAKMRLTSTYKSKKVSSSNEGALTAKADGNAPTGSNVVTVNKLASSQYVTSSDIKSLGLTKTSKLTDIVDAGGNKISEGTVFTIKTGEGASEKTSTLAVTSTTTVGDFISTLQNAGLNASFDEKQGRFFISSVDSGSSNKFSLTSTELSSSAVAGRNAIESAIDFNNLSSADKNTVKSAYTKIASGTYQEYYDASNALMDIAQKNANAEINKKATQYVTDVAKEHVKADNDEMEKITDAANESVKDTDFSIQVKAKYEADAKKEIENQLDKDISDGVVVLEDSSQRNVILKQRMDAQLKSAVDAKIADTTTYDADIAVAKQEAIDKAIENGINNKAKEIVNSQTGKDQIKYLEENGLSSTSLSDAVSKGIFDQADVDLVAVNSSNEFDSAAATATVAKNKVSTAVDAYRNISETTESATSALSVLGLGEIDGSAVASQGGSGMVVVAAADSEITLNGAILKGSTNNFTANGITFNLNRVTNPGEEITINVTNDVDATYNMVKDFVKEYNSILKEMNTLLHASSSKGYEPLTDDEKEAMSDDEVEKWETKIKDSLLRNDSTLESITNSMKSAMASSVSINGRNYSLSNYGIMTSSDYSEYGLLHIFGDADDSTYSNNADKLKKALQDDPDTVVNVLTGIAKNLYSAMADKMKTSGVSSALTFYNDKQINSELKNYKSQINTWEDRLQDMEDKYYKQFTAMEKAMQKMNEQSSYFSSMMGTN